MEHSDPLGISQMRQFQRRDGPPSRNQPIRYGASVPDTELLRSFDAVFPQSGPRFQEDCSEEIGATPRGRCILPHERTLRIAFGRGDECRLDFP